MLKSGRVEVGPSTLDTALHLGLETSPNDVGFTGAVEPLAVPLVSLVRREVNVVDETSLVREDGVGRVEESSLMLLEQGDVFLLPLLGHVFANVDASFLAIEDGNAELRSSDIELEGPGLDLMVRA